MAVGQRHCFMCVLGVFLAAVASVARCLPQGLLPSGPHCPLLSPASLPASSARGLQTSLSQSFLLCPHCLGSTGQLPPRPQRGSAPTSERRADSHTADSTSDLSACWALHSGRHPSPSPHHHQPAAQGRAQGWHGVSTPLKVIEFRNKLGFQKLAAVTGIPTETSFFGEAHGAL